LYTQGYTENATPDDAGNIMDVVLDLHGTVADLSYFLIVVHIAAALWSRVKGEGVWSSMVPILHEKEPTKNKMITKISALEDDFYNRVEGFFSTKEKR
jgi:cytochrome b